MTRVLFMLSMCVCVRLVAQSSLTLCNPMDSLPGSSVHGLLQARILEWVAISFSQESSQSRDQTWVSGDYRRSPALQVDFLLTEPAGKPFTALQPGSF